MPIRLPEYAARVAFSTAQVADGPYLGFMQPLRKEEALTGVDPRTLEDSTDVIEPDSSFKTFGGLLLATALGLYSWAALLLLLRWIW